MGAGSLRDMTRRSRAALAPATLSALSALAASSASPAVAARPALARSLAIGIAAALATALLCGATFAQPAPAPVDCPPTAQMPTPAQLQDGARRARDHGFLWRIEKAGRSSWLYGTLHVAKFDWMFPGPHTRAALQASDTVALELDVLDPEIARRMAAGTAALPEAPALPEAMQQRIARVARAECVALANLAALAPEMQITVLTTLLGRRDGLDPSFGIDFTLAGWGRAAGLAVVSLETPEAQTALLRATDAAEAEAFTDRALGEMESGRALPTLLRVANVWAEGDLPALQAYESWCQCVTTDADRADMKRLLDDRNPGLADGIDALHERGQRVFAGVGSLHMIGPTGLPALMAQRGYRVERVAW
jgi:uncharacterized protein